MIILFAFYWNMLPHWHWGGSNDVSCVWQAAMKLRRLVSQS